MFSERTPFYLIGTVCLFTTIILSLVSTFHIQKNGVDFFPQGGYYQGRYILDDSFVDKLCWYFSHLTHHTIFLLFTYFLMALLNIRSVKFFKIIAPIAITISVMYFYLLYPKQSQKIHQLSFSNFFSHFMIIFLVFGELMYIKEYTFRETTNCLVFIITALLCVYINYCLRGVWSYNMITLDNYYGWKLVSIVVLIMYLFSLMFYLFKYDGTNDVSWKESGYFLSSISQLIFCLGFTSVYGFTSIYGFTSVYN